MIEDQVIISRIQEGDAQAFEALIKRYKRLVGSIVYRMVKDTRDREEISQDVFIKAYRSLENFRGDAKVSTWLGRIAYTTCLDYLKKRKLPLYEDFLNQGEGDEDAGDRWEKLGVAEENPEISFEKEEFSRFLRTTIESLPPHYGTVLSLFHLEEQSIKEISVLMDMPDGTVKNYLFRARKLLKDKIQKSAYASSKWN